MNKNTPKIKTGVIIITYNAMPWADNCLIPLNKPHTNNRVYIIDNGSTDGTQDFIRKNCPDFYFHQSKENLGFGKANNLGLKKALEDGCTHFILLNQDAYLGWKEINDLVSIQLDHSIYGIISPLQLFNNQHVDLSHLQSLLKRNLSYFNDLAAGNNLNSLYEINYTNAAIWLISKECLKKVGGFDPLFPHYGEDCEYANRVNYFGFKVGLAPNVVGYHYRKQQEDNINKTTVYYYNSFLIKVKDLTRPVFSHIVRIGLELLRSTLGRLFGFRGLASKKSWSAFLKLCIDLNKVKKNRKMSLSIDYSFLNYDGTEG